MLSLLLAGGGPVGIWAYDSDSIVISYCTSRDNLSLRNDGGGFDYDGGTTNSVREVPAGRCSLGAARRWMCLLLILSDVYPHAMHTGMQVIEFCSSSNNYGYGYLFCAYAAMNTRNVTVRHSTSTNDGWGITGMASAQVWTASGSIASAGSITQVRAWRRRVACVCDVGPCGG